MPSCIINSCRFTGNQSEGFFKFPKDQNLNEKWCKSLQIETPKTKKFICYKHFESKDLHYTKKQKSHSQGKIAGEKFKFFVKMRSSFDATMRLKVKFQFDRKIFHHKFHIFRWIFMF